MNMGRWTLDVGQWTLDVRRCIMVNFCPTARSERYRVQTRVNEYEWGDADEES
jgi:hypothetical protein